MEEEEEAKRAFGGISDILKSIGLAWVVEQVEESITLGKTATTEADASEFIDDKIAGARRGRKLMQKFVTTRPFSALESLNLLLDAIERVMALTQFSTNAIKNLEAESIMFISERAGDLGHRMLITTSEQHEAARVRLRDLRLQVGGQIE